MNLPNSLKLHLSYLEIVESRPMIQTNQSDMAENRMHIFFWTLEIENGICY